jgi:hypothetical protein
MSKAKEEIGKGFIALGNIVGGLSLINSVFNKIAGSFEILAIAYIFIACYAAGYFIIKGADNGS